MAGLLAGVNAPYAPYVPPTPEEAALWAAQYPPYTLTSANAARAIEAMRRHGLIVGVRFEHDVMAQAFVYDVTIRDPETDRYDGESDTDLGAALDYAFASFCNIREGALRRELAAL